MVSKSRRRLSAEETRERLIDAGLDALAKTGLSIGLDAVTLDNAVRDAGVSRSSAYAVWSSPDEELSPQSAFQRAVLKQAVVERKETIARTHSTALEVIERMGGNVSPAQLFRELARVTGGVNARAVADSRSWQLVVGLRSVLNSAPAGARDQELSDWISESERLYRDETIREVYEPVAELLGLRPRAEFGDAAWHLGEIAAAALAEGLAPRYFMDTVSYLEGIDRVSPDGEDEKWSLFSVVFESIVLTFFEPIDPEGWVTEPD